MIETNEDLTQAVLGVMQQTTNPRLREIMVALITHLHGFVRDVKLTEEEFRTATALLNHMGQLSNDKHNETVLMAGALGVSSLVCLLNNGQNGATETQQNLLGPFWRMNSPLTPHGASIARTPIAGEQQGEDFYMHAQVVNSEGAPLEGAQVDIWHCSHEGLYENQDEAQAEMNFRGKFITDAQGRFHFHSLKMAGYPIPHTGLVGKLLAAQNRHPFRPAHIHALIFKEGYKTLITQIYADDDENLASDVQFGVTKALIGHFQKHVDKAKPYYTFDFTFKLEAGEAKLPQPPIK
jgi:catechol 1,2-dioxygenase